MLDNGNNSNCRFSDEMVSYIYDEIDSSSRILFETHLSGCTNCTDEFAAISNARLSVFEWQRDDFAHIPTPVFTIPGGAINGGKKRWSAFNLGMLFDLSNWPVAVAVSMLILIGIGFLYIRSSIGSGSDIVANIVVPVEEATNSDRNAERVISSLPFENDPVKNIKIEEGEKRAPKKAEVVHRQGQTRNLISDAPHRGKGLQNLDRVDPLPVINNYDDSDDRSLRLSDLFEGEVGATH